METQSTDLDFTPAHAVLKKYIDEDFLAMAACATLKGTEVIDFHLAGYQDRENSIELREDSIYRIFSNTKLITLTAIMQLWEKGLFKFSDPLTEYFPEFEDLQVLKPGSTDPTETEPLAVVPTINELLTHTAGFSYGIFQESPVDALYIANNVLHPENDLSQMVERLVDIPLATQPKTRFQYSVSADLTGRLVEILSGQKFGEYLDQHIFQPLNMPDTGFAVREGSESRLCLNYTPVDIEDPMKPGLFVAPDILGGFTETKPFESGGGGLVSTFTDYLRFCRMVQGHGSLDGEQILKPETLALMMQNHLPEGKVVELPNWEMPNTGFGYGFAVKLATNEHEPANMVGERHWGGLAGTHTWFNGEYAGIVFTQRMYGFWHPFIHDYKREFYSTIAS